MMEYSKQMNKLGRILFELRSEALGLDPNHLKDMECAKGYSILSHYHPACPEPDLTLGSTKLSDAGFVIILLQDHIGGLQVLHQNKWVDVQPKHGALVINLGDLLQVCLHHLWGYLPLTHFQLQIFFWQKKKNQKKGPLHGNASRDSNGAGLNGDPPWPALIRGKFGGGYIEFGGHEFLSFDMSRVQGGFGFWVWVPRPALPSCLYIYFTQQIILHNSNSNGNTTLVSSDNKL